MFQIEEGASFDERLQQAKDEVQFYQRRIAETNFDGNYLCELQRYAQLLSHWSSILIGLEEGALEIEYMKRQVTT